jgi:hypothetical protein
MQRAGFYLLIVLLGLLLALGGCRSDSDRAR